MASTVQNTREPEILAGRRAFSTAQALFSGGPLGPERALSVGWHDSSVNEEIGSFAVVQLNAGLDELIGEIVRVRFVTRTVFVYVLDVADVPWQLSLARRAFLALNRLSLEYLEAQVVAVQ